jgi:hypothetical protein
VGSDWCLRGPADAPHPHVSTGEAAIESTVDFLIGEWNVVRHISDYRTGRVGSFRGTATFVAETGLAGRVLGYHERGELRFGGHAGPATRTLLYRDLADGSVDVRFADGRQFYRLDLRGGPWSACHPCGADEYLVKAARLSPDSFTETWKVAGPAKDYELVTTYTRTAARTKAGG